MNFLIKALVLSCLAFTVRAIWIDQSMKSAQAVVENMGVSMINKSNDISKQKRIEDITRSWGTISSKSKDCRYNTITRKLLCKDKPI